jgi:hypothetical protein
MSSYTDNSLIQLFLPIIQAGLIADGFTTTLVKQSNQPTQQGVPTAPLVFFTKIFNKRFGFLRRADVWNTLTSQFDHTESQYYETTFQVSALVLQDPTDLTIPTASDLVNEVACIMQSSTTLDTLNNAGVGILRISDITNPYFVDDHDNYEASPSFDFVLVYLNERVSTSPLITPPISQNIHGV